MFALSNFLSTDFGYKFPLFLVFGVEPNLSPLRHDPYTYCDGPE